MATFAKLNEMYNASHDDRGLHLDTAERLRAVTKNTPLLLEYISHLEAKLHIVEDAFSRAKEDLAAARGRREEMDRKLSVKSSRITELERAIVEMAVKFTPAQF